MSQADREAREVSRTLLEETLGLLRRIERENAENKNAIGERVAFLSWGTQVALEEQIKTLELAQEEAP